MISWWASPEVQHDRALFLRAVADQEARWREQQAYIERLLNCLKTVDYMVGTPQRRRGWATGRPQVSE